MPHVVRRVLRKNRGLPCVASSMRAMAYSQTGDSSVLHFVERDVPEPGAGEVRVNVVVSGVNPTDWKARAGARPGRPTPFPEVVPNQDGSGVVDAVGSGVGGFEVGDRVWVYLAAHERPTGTAQEYAVLPAERVVHLPDAASFELGASLGVPAMTAHRALTVADGGPARLGRGALDGRTVLVAGGAGAVGHAAIQLARWSGARVITTVSSPRRPRSPPRRAPTTSSTTERMTRRRPSARSPPTASTRSSRSPPPATPSSTRASSPTTARSPCTRPMAAAR